MKLRPSLIFMPAGDQTGKNLRGAQAEIDKKKHKYIYINTKMHSQIQIQILFHDESRSKWQKVEGCTRENTACSLIIAIFINSQTQPLWIYVMATF